MPSHTKISISILLFVLAVIAVVGVSMEFSHYSQLTNPSPLTTSSQSSVQTATTSDAANSQTLSSAQSNTSNTPTGPDAVTPPEPANFIRATLLVASTTYQLAVPPGNSLESGMQLLVTQSANLPHPFSFTQKTYPGMGEFIESINGIANTSSKYWFVYVNGTESSTGVSNIIIHSGDVIDWRFEGASNL